MLKSRKYKSGSKWALWRWTETPSDYIRRLHVIMTPWFAICLHWINKPDAEPHLHDHPVSFLSLILRGGYCEVRGKFEHSESMGFAGGSWSEEHKTHRWFNWIRATDWDRHRIVHVFPKTLTLCFMGPKTRQWGFHTEDGWVYWKDYNAAKYKTTP